MSIYPRYELMDTVWEVNFLSSCREDNIKCKLQNFDVPEEAIKFLKDKGVDDCKIEGAVEMFYKMPANKALLIWKNQDTVFMLMF